MLPNRLREPDLSQNKIKTAIPPNGVTARCVSRRINRSSDNRAVISRGTGLSVAFVPIPLLSQILGGNLTLHFGFQVNLNKAVKRTLSRFPEDFMFQLTAEEAKCLRFQNGMS